MPIDPRELGTLAALDAIQRSGNAANSSLDHCLLVSATTALRAADPTDAAPKIDRATAEIALGRVPSGEIKEVELEREHGRLVWSFDIAQRSSRNVTEVQVDANDGKVVSVQIETTAGQAKEAAADRATAHSTKPR